MAITERCLYSISQFTFVFFVSWEIFHCDYFSLKLQKFFNFMLIFRCCVRIWMGGYASCNTTQNFPISINIPMSIMSEVPFAAVFVNSNKPERIATFKYSEFCPVLGRRLYSTHWHNQYFSQGECRILFVTLFHIMSI